MSVKRSITDKVPVRLRSSGRYWYRRVTGRLDPAMAILGPMLRAGTTAVDVGAHNGVYTYYLERAGLHVEAFEPVPECQAVIAAMRGDITLHRVALSDGSGATELVVPLQYGAPETQLAHLGERAGEQIGARLEVTVATLDSFALRDVSIVKIDVEGHELAVLRGARETLGRDHPLLYMEIERRHAGAQRMHDTFAMVAEEGYSTFVVQPDGLLMPGERLDVEVHQDRFVAGDRSAPYLNNFLFVHRTDAAALRYLRGRIGSRPA